jgi:hypothetical protein
VICRKCSLDLGQSRFRPGRLTCKTCSDGGSGTARKQRWREYRKADAGIEIPIDEDLAEWDQGQRTEPNGFQSVPIGSNQETVPERIEKWLLIPDCHIPYHDEQAFSLMLRAAKACGIQNVAILGDFADFYAVSFHGKDPRRRNDLKWEVEEVCKGLDRLDAQFPGKKKFIEGNHCDRLQRYLAEHAAALYTTCKVQELFRLAERGWEYTPYKHHTKIGRLHLTHDAGIAGRYAAQRTLDAYQANVVIGHTHRLSFLVEGNAKGEAHVGAMLGWLGDVEKVDYMHQIRAKREWAHGFGLAYHDKVTDNVHLVPVAIVDGTVAVEGRLVA